MRGKYLIILITAFFYSNCLSQPLTKFSAKAVQEDLKYLYETLVTSHYDLYVNTRKDVFDKEYKRISELITDSLTTIQINRLFQPFTALSKLEHCSMEFPLNSYISFLQRGGKVFPLNVNIEKNQVLISDDFSTDSSVVQGDEIISLNGRPIEEVLQGIYCYLSGESNDVKNTWAVGLYSFPRLHWIVYDRCDTFNIGIRKRDGSGINVKVAAIPAIEFEGKIAIKKPVLDPHRGFSFIGDIAYLHPGQFANMAGGGSIGSEKEAYESGEFRRFLDSCFLEIYKKKARCLIVDLQGNPGGSNTFSDPMVAFFATKPFSFCSKFIVRTSQKTKDFWKDISDPTLMELRKEILTHENGSRFEVSITKYQARQDSLRFRGKVYVLINRYTYSNATVTAAMIQDYGFGKLVGKGTVDAPTVYGSIQNFRLPNTQMLVSYPKALTIRPNGDTSLHGVVPDYEVKDNQFSNNDDILDYALKLIREGNY
jgi:hypothetical protein